MVIDVIAHKMHPFKKVDRLNSQNVRKRGTACSFEHV